AATGDAHVLAEEQVDSATVTIDGEPLFRVIGVSSYPAARRAARVVERIETLANDRQFDPASLKIVDMNGLAIVAGDTIVMRVLEADATLERVSRTTLVNANLTRIRQAVTDYRALRTREALLSAVGRALAAAAAAAALIALARWLFKAAQTRLQHTHERNAATPVGGAIPALRRDALQAATQRALGVAKIIIVITLALAWVQYALGQFPATRGFARGMLAQIISPLTTIWRGLVGAVPDLTFLAVLYVVTRFGLVLMQQYFAALERGTLRVAGFDRDWAQPTYKLLRVVAVIFALVVAYPYIPGSSTPAFKGVSVFVGVLFSLGSSSAIANLIAGYTLIYRRAFKIGDLVKLTGCMGMVTAVRLQATHVRTIKNEEITIPNSAIMAGQVTNFSALARSEGLVLHTKVRIGYGVPWRQVEAMLLEAARRTPGLLSEPPPSVQQLALGEFGVTYELNAYCNDPFSMVGLYSGMHRNVLDVFNEYDVEITTPSYSEDPHERKVVPQERWYSAPARPAAPDPTT
ncbi:MAG: mechanosensitive ion channel, partial [Proteobacteria bacterium]|nr:mechanosensitive ion channel [Pseudomonadota bacterium]